jgi:hypothetical protein
MHARWGFHWLGSSARHATCLMWVMGTRVTWTSAHFSLPLLRVMLLAALWGGVACKSATGACNDPGGCLCPAKEEGKSICVGCGRGYDCSAGHRIYFWDGECDAHSAACGYSPKPCSPTAAVGERTLCMCANDVGSQICQPDMTLSDCICGRETRYCSLAGGRCANDADAGH